MSYIQVWDLCKRFYVRKKRSSESFLREKETIQALADVSFDIDRGELIGYIGPNGAGKSTTVKILSGIMTPDSGEVRVGSQIPWKDRKSYVKHIGVVFGQRMQLWWDVDQAVITTLRQRIQTEVRGIKFCYSQKKRQSF